MILACQKIEKAFGGKSVLNNVNFLINEGEKAAVIGINGAGKTTLFNRLTGSNQHVGNFPGVTVDRKDGVIKNHSDTLITDLPGIYSMSPYSSEDA